MSGDRESDASRSEPKHPNNDEKSPADSKQTTPSTPSEAAPGLPSSLSRSSSVTISGGGKRRRLVSETGGAHGFLGDIPPSPPKFASLDEIMQAAKGVSNMALAHEIAVDKDFKLEKSDPPTTTFHGAVKSAVHRAFWDFFDEKLKHDPPDFEGLVNVLADVRHLFEGLLMPHQSRLKSRIQEVLDLDLIRQQADAGTINPYGFTEYLINLSSQLCAPVRDEAVADLKRRQTERAPLGPLLKDLIELLELMRIDMANFTIQQMRPYIQSQSVEYEKTKFTQFLDTQTDGLRYTKLWLEEASTVLKETAGSSTAGSSVSTPAEILAEAYASLLTRPAESTTPFPETLLMDEGRLLHLHDAFDRIVIVGATLLLVYNAVGAPIAGLATLKQDLKKHIQVLLGPLPSDVEADGASPDISPLPDRLESIFERIRVDVAGALAAHVFPPLSDETWSQLGEQVKSLHEPNHPVVAVVVKRVRGFVKGAVGATHTEAPLQIPPGLSGLQGEIVDLTSSFVRIVAHNRAVFGDYYQDIVTELTRGSAEGEEGGTSGTDGLD